MILRYQFTATIALTQIAGSLAAFDLFGLRKSIYNPRCAHACREPISTSALTCTEDNDNFSSSKCHATDDSFLQTLAHCISRHCKLPIEELETYWRRHATGWEIVDPAPKYSYEIAVRLAGTPVQTVSWGNPLTNVSVINEKDYEKSYDSLLDWTDNENLHARYA